MVFERLKIPSGESEMQFFRCKFSIYLNHSAFFFICRQKIIDRNKRRTLSLYNLNENHLNRMRSLPLLPFFVLLLAFSPVSTQAQSNICLSDLLSAVSSDAESDLAQGVFSTANKWVPGKTIRVRFLDGSSYVREKVKSYAIQWEQYANVDFVFVNSGYAEIRVSFSLQKGSSWSLVGTVSEQYSVNQQLRTYKGTDGVSMNFGWFDENTSEEEFRRTTLHEFGHALGLLHEHKHSDRVFEWNIPVVLNYYMNKMGWSKQQVYEQVIERYGEDSEYSNKRYDKYSIMHYPVPKEFTKNGYSVGLNSVLSTADKEIIAEMYPPEEEEEEEDAEKEFTFKDIKIEHNAYSDGKKGMRINVQFDISGALSVTHRMVCYFYDSDGDALTDTNGEYSTTNDKVSVGKDFTPNYQSASYTSFNLFIPYSELHLGCGEHQLKFKIVVWDKTKSDWDKVANSGFTYFSYWKCSSIKDIEVDVKHNVMVDGRKGMKIYPQFAIKHGKDTKCRVSAYFYFDDGRKLKDFNDAYNTTDGHVSTGTDIKPCCEITNYSLGDYYDFYLFMPYSELHLDAGAFYNLKFYVVVWDGDRKIEESDWITFTIDKR